MAAYRAFRKPALVDDSATGKNVFGDVAERRARYDLLWALFGNTAYDTTHSWSGTYKNAYDLYPNIRALYNPSARIATFYEMYLLGGSLSTEEGQGALPLEGASDELREAIGRLWRDSNWAANKDVLSLWGAVLGDAAVEVVPDYRTGKMHLRLMHPSHLEAVEVDDYGHVKGFTETRLRDDPNGGDRQVTYMRRVSRDGDTIVTETYRDGAPFAWPENVSPEGEAMAAWEEPFGFVPLVLIQHRNVGSDWGWSELQPSLSKFREVDEQASLISDAVRKQQNPALFAPGASPIDPITFVHERNSTPILYHPSPNQRLDKIDISLSLSDAIAHLSGLLGRLEGDYPELEFEKVRLSGTVSGVALEIAQGPAATKIRQRRVGYDAALVRAHQMAVAIGGELGWSGYDKFGLASYDAGELDHEISERPVFETSRALTLEAERAFWGALRDASAVGGVDEALARAGYTDEAIAEFNRLPERAAMIARAAMLSGGAGG